MTATTTRGEAAQIVLAVVFLVSAVPKLAGAHSAVTMFTRIGAGQWLRYLVGTAELAGAAGLLIPPLAGLAAGGLAAGMAGATIINIAVLHSAAAIATIALCAALASMSSAWQMTGSPRSEPAPAWDRCTRRYTPTAGPCPPGAVPPSASPASPLVAESVCSGASTG
jgi:putative oxidoreductase